MHETAYGDDLAYNHDVGHGDFARRAGFGITRVRGYGQLRFPGSHIGFLAVKPGARASSSLESRKAPLVKPAVVPRRRV